MLCTYLTRVKKDDTHYKALGLTGLRKGRAIWRRMAWKKLAGVVKLQTNQLVSWSCWISKLSPSTCQKQCHGHHYQCQLAKVSNLFSSHPVNQDSYITAKQKGEDAVNKKWVTGHFSIKIFSNNHAIQLNRVHAHAQLCTLCVYIYIYK